MNCLSAFLLSPCIPARKPRRRHSRPSATNMKSRKKGGGVKAAKRPKGLALITSPLSAMCCGLMGREERLGECPARAGQILFHPEKIGVDFRGEFIAMPIYSIVFIHKNMKNLMFMKMQDAEKTWELIRGQAGQGTVLRTTGFNVNEKISAGYRDAMNTTVEQEDRVVLRDLQEQIEGEAHFIFSGQIVRGTMFFANPSLKKAQLRVPQLVQLSQEKHYDHAA